MWPRCDGHCSSEQPLFREVGQGEPCVTRGVAERQASICQARVGPGERGSGEDGRYVRLRQLPAPLCSGFWIHDKLISEDEGLRSVNNPLLLSSIQKKPQPLKTEENCYVDRAAGGCLRTEETKVTHIHIKWLTAARSAESLVLTRCKWKILFKQKDQKSCMCTSQKAAAFKFTDQHLT